VRKLNKREGGGKRDDGNRKESARKKRRAFFGLRKRRLRRENVRTTLIFMGNGEEERRKRCLFLRGRNCLERWGGGAGVRKKIREAKLLSMRRGKGPKAQGTSGGRKGGHEKRMFSVNPTEKKNLAVGVDRAGKGEKPTQNKKISGAKSRKHCPNSLGVRGGEVHHGGEKASLKSSRELLQSLSKDLARGKEKGGRTKGKKEGRVV